ncbi:MAG: hypothetical protein J6G98_04060 [Bacilli bacterium]|nr:hypothetical protein [Bacilli bacterium]
MKRILKYLKVLLIIILLVFLYDRYLLLKKDIRIKRGENIVFLGDSLMARYDTNLYFRSFNVINSGIGGNMTQDILNDLEGRVFKYKPKKVFILVGTNDIVYSDLKLSEIKDNVNSIIESIKEYDRNIDIYLESIYPVIEDLNEDIVYHRKNKTIIELNGYYKDLCSDKCTYINVFDSLKDKTGNLKRYYTKDGVHLNKIGYLKVSRILYKYMNFNNLTNI